MSEPNSAEFLRQHADWLEKTDQYYREQNAARFRRIADELEKLKKDRNELLELLKKELMRE